MKHLIRWLLPIIAAASLTATVTAQTEYSPYVQVGAGANDGCYYPVVSGDGVHVAFYTDATNIGGGAGPGILVWNTSSNTYEIASTGLIAVSRPSISRDGKLVAFYGQVSVPGTLRLYIYEVGSGVAPSDGPFSLSGASGPALDTWPPAISDEISTGVWRLASRELATSPSVPFQIRIWTTNSRSTTVISKDGSGNLANEDCSQPVISADGTKVAFVSDATNLAGNSGGSQQVFLTELSGTWSTTEVVSKSSGGTLGVGLSSYPSMSANADRIAFVSNDDTLGASTMTGSDHVYVRERSSSTTLIPYSSGIGAGSDNTAWPNISADGNVLAYMCFATNGGNIPMHNDANFIFPQLTDPGPPIQTEFGFIPYAQNLDPVFTSPPTTPSIRAVAFRDAGANRYYKGGYLPNVSADGSAIVYHTFQQVVIGGPSALTFPWAIYANGATW